MLSGCHHKRSRLNPTFIPHAVTDSAELCRELRHMSALLVLAPYKIPSNPIGSAKKPHKPQIFPIGGKHTMYYGSRNIRGGSTL